MQINNAINVYVINANVKLFGVIKITNFFLSNQLNMIGYFGHHFEAIYFKRTWFVENFF